MVDYHLYISNFQKNGSALYNISWAGAIKDTSLNFQRGHLSKRASLQASLKL